MQHKARAERAPRRDELERAARRPLVGSAAGKADVWTMELHGARIVVKDFARRSFWGRLAGRVQIAREARAYAWLAGEASVPRFLGRIDAHALALAWVEGEQLSRAARGGGGATLYARLCRIVERFHAAGLAHLDLGGRENVLLGADGQVYVLDLAGAVCFRPGSLGHRLLFPLAARTDRAALLKWKRLLDAGAYTPEEQTFLRRQRAWRALWPFNRKQRRQP